MYLLIWCFLTMQYLIIFHLNVKNHTKFISWEQFCYSYNMKWKDNICFVHHHIFGAKSIKIFLKETNGRFLSHGLSLISILWSWSSKKSKFCHKEAMLWFFQWRKKLLWLRKSISSKRGMDFWLHKKIYWVVREVIRFQNNKLSILLTFPRYY